MQERRDVRARAALMQEQSRLATLGVDRPTTRTRERGLGGVLRESRVGCDVRAKD
jgi:hypothetical protein